MVLTLEQEPSWGRSLGRGSAYIQAILPGRACLGSRSARGQMRGRSYIWKVPFGSLPGCCSKLSPELALTLRVQLPSTSIPLPGPTPHSAPFPPSAFLSCGL